MNELMRYSTALSRRIGGGHKSFKRKFKEEGIYNKVVRCLKYNGFNPRQIKSIMRETQPFTEFEVIVMINENCDLLEARNRIHSAMQYGLIEFDGGQPCWMK